VLKCGDQKYDLNRERKGMSVEGEQSLGRKVSDADRKDIGNPSLTDGS